MKFALSALLILAIIWLYPLAAEVSGDACGALASAALRIETGSDPMTVSPTGVSLIPPTGDFIAADTARGLHPSLPSPLVCTGYYWRLVADPGFVRVIQNPDPQE